MFLSNSNHYHPSSPQAFSDSDTSDDSFSDQTVQDENPQPRGAQHTPNPSHAPISSVRSNFPSPSNAHHQTPRKTFQNQPKTGKYCVAGHLKRHPPRETKKQTVRHRHLSVTTPPPLPSRSPQSSSTTPAYSGMYDHTTVSTCHVYLTSRNVSNKLYHRRLLASTCNSLSLSLNVLHIYVIALLGLYFCLLRMERGFQAMLFGGDSSGAFSPAFIGQTTDDDTAINAMYSAMNAQSFLSVTDEKYLLHSLDYDYGTFPVAPSVDPVTFGLLGEDFLASQSKEVGECSVYGDRKLKSVDFVAEKLKLPKYEPANNVEVVDVSTEPFNFISKSPDSVSRAYDLRFRQLPDLQSLEQFQDGFAFGESSRKRVKSFSPTTTDPRTLESVVRNFQLSNYPTVSKQPEIQEPAVVPQSSLARQRRQKISDKTRCLQKLLPWDKKMDMATMLEEAYKYVKFLQAQISVLQSMPCDSSSFTTQNPSNVSVFGGLGRLNRQQLLQVLVNSPVVQTILYSKGSCVYSIEQLALLRKMAERKALYQQVVLFDPSALP